MPRPIALFRKGISRLIPTQPAKGDKLRSKKTGPQELKGDQPGQRRPGPVGESQPPINVGSEGPHETCRDHSTASGRVGDPAERKCLDATTYLPETYPFSNAGRVRYLVRGFCSVIKPGDEVILLLDFDENLTQGAWSLDRTAVDAIRLLLGRAVILERVQVV